MARKEPNTIIPSSQDAFVIFDNDTPTTRPFVDIQLTGYNNTVELDFTYTDGEEEVTFVIKGEKDGFISQTSFNTSGSITAALLCLNESVKLNTPMLTRSTMRTTDTLRVWLDASVNWNVTATNANITDGYSQYADGGFPKFVLNITRDDGNEYSMEAYADSDTVSFNITSPFVNNLGYEPSTLSMMAYKSYQNVCSTLSLNNSRIAVMPSTLTADEKFTLEDWCVNSTREKPFLSFRSELTSRDNPYFEGTLLVLSVLHTDAHTNWELEQTSYTSGGKLIGTTNPTAYQIHYDNRTDLYFTPTTDTTPLCAYFDVRAYSSSGGTTKTLRFQVYSPHCANMNTLYFINKWGGVDSWTFTDEETDTQVSKNNLYYKQWTDTPDDVWEKRNVMTKQMSKTHIWKSKAVSEAVAKGMEGLQRTKYAFTLDSSMQRHIMIVKTLTTQRTMRSDSYDIECTLERSDDNLLF